MPTNNDQEILDIWLDCFQTKLIETFKQLKNDWSKSYSMENGNLKEFSEHSHLLRKKIDLVDAMFYSASSGKRVRPLLMAASYLACGGENLIDNKTLIKFALALEFIHSYSLIHDDLPALDNDDTRRGKPSCHIKFGEDTAIIAGDALLNLSYEISISTLTELVGNDLNRGIQAISNLSFFAGIKGMIGGQAIDLKENIINSKSILEIMVEKKTCALFMAAARIGGILASANEDELKSLTSYAFKLGMAFQLRDDELDKYEDKKIGKKTLFNMYNSGETYTSVSDLTEEANGMIQNLKRKEILFMLSNNLISRNF